MRLLIAEDDPRLLRTLVHIFEANKFTADGAASGPDALAHGRSGMYDGFVLDIMMPGLDGIEVLKTLRAEGISAPALFLTARSEVSQRVEGLDAGADDYLPKPFSTAELLARVRAMLRRKDNFLPDRLALGPVTLDRAAHRLEFAGRSESLSGKEFQLLEALMQSPGAVLPTERLLAKLWGWDAGVDASVVWVHISNLRRKLAALDAPLEIRFLRGGGYLLEAKP